MNNSVRELQIRLAYRLMCASYALSRWSSDWMSRLVLSRPKDFVERMERDKGIGNNG